MSIGARTAAKSNTIHRQSVSERVREENKNGFRHHSSSRIDQSASETHAETDRGWKIDAQISFESRIDVRCISVARQTVRSKAYYSTFVINYNRAIDRVGVVAFVRSYFLGSVVAATTTTAAVYVELAMDMVSHSLLFSEPVVDKQSCFLVNDADWAKPTYNMLNNS